MATKKPAKQPADSKQLKSEVDEAVDEAAKEAKTGDVATVPEDEGGPAAYQGHDRR